MARPEGFEPPTLRSEVRFTPQLQEITKKKPSILKSSVRFNSTLLRLIPRHCGNMHGNKFYALCGSNCVAPGIKRMKSRTAALDRLTNASNRARSNLATSGGKDWDFCLTAKMYEFAPCTSPGLSDAIGLWATMLRCLAISSISVHNAACSAVSKFDLSSNLRSTWTRLEKRWVMTSLNSIVSFDSART